MEKKLVWENLLCEDRVRSSSDSSNERNGFEADYDRIVGSSSVRRLQDKAQVFPLQENDFTRTRLTHSLTVSSIARSMGKKIGLYLEENQKKISDENRLNNCRLCSRPSVLSMISGIHHSVTMAKQSSAIGSLNGFLKTAAHMPLHSLINR